MARSPSGRRSAARRARKSELDSLWRDKPELIAAFVAARPDYEQLCAEVHYILKKRLADERIEVAGITSRAKTLKSFLGKIRRKGLTQPLSEIADLAGVRAVCLYGSDLPHIEEIVRQEFDVREKVDKVTEQGADRFGYGAVHFVVNLGKKSSGARYDDLKALPCEIQTRTVVQDAWAIIEHHLAYKAKIDVPSALRRKLNSLSGLLETADDQFDRIREERDAYLANLQAVTEAPDILSQELNLDTLLAYIVWKFPDSEPPDSTAASLTLESLNRDRYATVLDVDKAVGAAASALERIPPPDFWGADLILDIALANADPEFNQAASWLQAVRQIGYVPDQK